jgi:adenosylcobinamide-GDP ribazoletransferase
MQEPEPADRRWPAIGSWIGDLASMLGLITILPIGDGAPPRRAVRALPLAGAVTGAAGGAVLAGALMIGLSPLVAAVLATAFLVALGGGLHEDGLADTADGFGGGADRTGKLAIMRDSMIGSYGAIALIMALMARVVLTAEIAGNTGAAAAGAALVAAGALSRGAITVVLCRLGPARDDGLGRAFAMPGATVMRQAAGAALLLAAAALALPIGLAGLAAALAGAAFATFLIAGLAMRQIGGQTGDVCGAVQQGAEISALVGLALAS